jgi:hypothetical protein
MLPREILGLSDVLIKGYILMNIFFFFDKSIYYIKKRKGAQPLVHWEYTKGFRGRKKIGRGNLQS